MDLAWAMNLVALLLGGVGVHLDDLALQRLAPRGLWSTTTFS
jgi:hypothetical protein